jgi:hypothetical protein
VWTALDDLAGDLRYWLGGLTSLVVPLFLFTPAPVHWIFSRSRGLSGTPAITWLNGFIASQSNNDRIRWPST